MAELTVWLAAEAGWAGAGRWFGRCVIQLVGEHFDATGPVPIDEVPSGATIHDISGTLLLGLRDAHTHLTLIDPFNLASGGIAAADDLGGAPVTLAGLQQRSQQPGSGLPEIRFAGAFLTAPGGYPSDRSWAPAGSWREVQSVDDAELAAGEQLAAGASFLKVALNAAAGPVLPTRVLSALVGAAHRNQCEVVAHVEGPGMLGLALDAGIDRLAHTPWTERLDPSMLKAAASQQIWISTMAIHAGAVGEPTAMANLRGFLAAGGQVRYGTDLGNGPLPAGVNADEIRALMDAGMTVDDVLVAMTDGPKTSGTFCHLPSRFDTAATGFAEAMLQARVLTPELGTRMSLEGPG